MDQKSIDDMVGHIDINSMDQFGGKDFEKLIKKVTLTPTPPSLTSSNPSQACMLRF